MGSSPHTRDKFIPTVYLLPLIRIIPAYAGQIRVSEKIAKLDKDHPRIRGTNDDFETIKSQCKGSSPHTRDKLKGSMNVMLVLGIIPAYAGQIDCSD